MRPAMGQQFLDQNVKVIKNHIQKMNIAKMRMLLKDGKK